MLRDAETILDIVDVALAQTEADTDVHIPFRDIAGAVSDSRPMQDN